MIDFAIKKWNKNKEKLRQYFENNIQEEYAKSYADFTKKVIDVILNDDDYGYFNGEQEDRFSIEKFFKEVDFGDYQGTLIYIFAYDTYQPSTDETFYTSVNYGSCSGCDTLLSINEYETDTKPSEKQVDKYMQLSLHLIQEMKCFR